MPASLPDPIIFRQKLRNGVVIHTFVSAFTDNNIANATHIVESRHALVLIDGQFLKTYATRFRAYADSLGKPIHRLYISHGHPDHWFGLASGFASEEIYALPETIDFVAANGATSRRDHQKKLGDEAPPSVVGPKQPVTPGTTVIDGVTYVFDRVMNTEFDFILTIRLPELGVCIPQDLIYSGTHLYLTKNFQNWIGVLGQLLKSDDELFLAGHGFPCRKDEVAKNIEYLTAASQAMAGGLAAEAFKEYLLHRYPDRLCPGIFDIYLPRLFDGASQV